MVWLGFFPTNEPICNKETRASMVHSFTNQEPHAGPPCWYDDVIGKRTGHCATFHSKYESALTLVQRLWLNPWKIRKKTRVTISIYAAFGNFGFCLLKHEL